MNVDWFQPFEHTVYSVGVISITFLNLPRLARFKRENIIVVGVIPGLKEPSLHMNIFFITTGIRLAGSVERSRSQTT